MKHAWLLTFTWLLTTLVLGCSQTADDDVHPPSTTTSIDEQTAPIDCVGLAVRVVDPDGQPVVGARITPTLGAMIGPAGAFGVEGGQLEQFERPALETDAHGSACVPDERNQIAQLHRQRSGAAASSSSLAGAVEVRFPSLTLDITHAAWTPAKLELGDDENAGGEPVVVHVTPRFR
jgi:hypothetical protein